MTKNDLIKIAIVASKRLADVANKESNSFVRQLTKLLGMKGSVDSAYTNGELDLYEKYMIEQSNAQLMKLAEATQLLRSYGPLLLAIVTAISDDEVGGAVPAAEGPTGPNSFAMLSPHDLDQLEDAINQAMKVSA